MSQKHTPGPFESINSVEELFGPDSEIYSVSVQNRFGQSVLVATCPPSPDISNEQRQLNSRRIRDCLNACEGIEDPAQDINEAIVSLKVIERLGFSSHLSNEFQYLIHNALKRLGAK